MATEPFRLEPD